MLRQRMHADDDVRAPFFKNIANITDTAFLEKLARLGTNFVHHPVEIFHPMLPVAQDPVVNIDEFFGNVMRFFDGFDGADGKRFACPEFLQTGGNSDRCRAVSAAGIG
jgi:hypothetical protein